jgi:bacteriocin-like protein
MKKKQGKVKKLSAKEMKTILGGMNKTELVKAIAEKA